MQKGKEQEYKNLSILEIFDFIKTNPNKSTKLKYTTKENAIVNEFSNLDDIGLDDFQKITLNPSNPISFFCYLTDPLFEIASINDRLTMIRKSVPIIIERIQNIKNSPLSRKRKQLREIVSKTLDGPLTETSEIHLLFETLARIQNIQLLVVNKNQTEKNISFFPTVLEWEREIPVYILDFNTKWVARNISTEENKRNIGTWICKLENNGWVIGWSILNKYTKKELLEHIEHVSEEKKISLKSYTKEELSIFLGKTNSVHVLYNIEA